jgi:hypothetical protein
MSAQSDHDPFIDARGSERVAPGADGGAPHARFKFSIDRVQKTTTAGTMADADQDQQLLRSLSASLADHARGFTAEAAGPSGVLILNNGHYRGVWRWMDGSYAFTPGGYGTSTHSAVTPQDAVRFTLDHVCRQ